MPLLSETDNNKLKELREMPDDLEVLMKFKEEPSLLMQTPVPVRDTCDISVTEPKSNWQQHLEGENIDVKSSDVSFFLYFSIPVQYICYVLLIFFLCS